jgi:ATP-dependent DNA ligase
VLGTFENGEPVYRGRVGTGFSDKQRTEIWQRLQPLRLDTKLKPRGI